MMLVEDGKLRLDDPLSTHLESVPPAWQRITIRHLLTHTSDWTFQRCRASTAWRR